MTRLTLHLNLASIRAEHTVLCDTLAVVGLFVGGERNVTLELFSDDSNYAARLADAINRVGAPRRPDAPISSDIVVDSRVRVRPDAAASRARGWTGEVSDMLDGGSCLVRFSADEAGTLQPLTMIMRPEDLEPAP